MTLIRFALLYMLPLLMASYVVNGHATTPPNVDNCKSRSPNDLLTQLLCSDDEIKLLDRRLGKFYQASLSLAKKPHQTRQAQKTWLSALRLSCKLKTCIVNAYNKRTVQLATSLVSETTQTATKLDKHEVPKVCNRVVALNDSNKLQNHIIPFLDVDLAKKISAPAAAWAITKAIDGARTSGANYVDSIYNGLVVLHPSKRSSLNVFFDAYDGGTCFSSKLLNASLGRKVGETMLPVDDPSDDLQWSWWGAGDKVASVDGRLYSLTSWGDSELRLISWIRPDGRILPLCSVDQTWTKEITRSDQPSVCIAIEKGDAIAPDWNLESENFKLGDDWQLGREATATLEVAEIEIRGFGDKQEIARVSYDSSAGCGAQMQWLRVVNQNRDGLAPSKLNEMLTSFADGHEVDVRTIGSDTYASAFDKFGRGATYRLSATGADKVCQFNPKPLSRVSKYWSISTSPHVR
jgi:uncharacterized protein